MRLVILRAGDAVLPVRERRGDFPELIRGTLDRAYGEAARIEWGEHDLRDDAALPAIDASAGFIVTGSSCSVAERAPWMLRAEEYLRRVVAAGAPLLGICFGHQLLAQALGGLVARNPRGREIGTVRVRRSGDDPLFDGLPEEFDANASHLDTVVRLPEGARLLAFTALEPNAAFSVGDRARAVQFHPEFDGDVVRGYIRARAEAIRSEGGDPDRLVAAAVDAPFGAATLANFARYFAKPVATRASPSASTSSPRGRSD